MTKYITLRKAIEKVDSLLNPIAHTVPLYHMLYLRLNEDCLPLVSSFQIQLHSFDSKNIKYALYFEMSQNMMSTLLYL